MASEEYQKALKMARNAYRRAVSAGRYPYLPALDDLVRGQDVKTEESLGLVSIPLDQIVGTKSEGRQNAFAVNFMPLMPEHSEFARKWDGVVAYHMDQGVGDPIVAYEFMNRFYVLEGNKRVSVLKFFGADSIEGTVTRVIPYKNDEIENRIYFEFLDFYKGSQINYLWFTQVGSFPKLLKAVGKQAGEEWTDVEKEDFKSLYTEFAGLFKDKGGDRLDITAGDALLFYLSLYSYKEILEKGHSEKSKDLSKIWEELSLIGHNKDQTLVYSPTVEPSASVFSRFFKLTSSKVLNVAFIHDRSTEISGWTYGHELGRMSLEQIFGSQIHTEAYFLKDEQTDVETLIERAIAAGNHIIFTTSQKFLKASLKAAIENPKVKILNCSVGMPHSAIRTYYGRIFEAKYLGGMIAGAMCENDKICFVEQYPIFGSMANINAFALGARMTNPRVKIYLHWNTETGCESFDELIRREQISIVSDNDMIRPADEAREFGLYKITDSGIVKLAAPIWNWGRFYERIIRDFLQGNWEKTEESLAKPAVNYWWGISSGIIDLVMSKNLPEGVRRFAEIMKHQIREDNFDLNPFAGQFRSQDGTLRGVKDGALSATEVIAMDYLADSVIGHIPALENLTDEAKAMIEMEKAMATLQEESAAGIPGSKLTEDEG